MVIFALNWSQYHFAPKRTVIRQLQAVLVFDFKIITDFAHQNKRWTVFITGICIQLLVQEEGHEIVHKSHGQIAHFIVVAKKQIFLAGNFLINQWQIFKYEYLLSSHFHNNQSVSVDWKYLSLNVSRSLINAFANKIGIPFQYSNRFDRLIGN